MLKFEPNHTTLCYIQKKWLSPDIHEMVNYLGHISTLCGLMEFMILDFESHPIKYFIREHAYRKD